MPEERDLLSLFCYSQEERETFPYLDRYMHAIQERLDEIEESREALKAFMLAGLFLTYRACNHGSSPMSTEAHDFPEDSIHAKRLQVFKEFGESIESTSDYLDQINYGMIKMFFVRPERFLVRLVQRALR